MSTEGNTRAKGRKPGIKRARFESVVEAVNARRPEMAAMVADEDGGEISISLHVGGNTAARFKGFAGTWRAHVIRLVGLTAVDTGSKLFAASALAYTEKDAGKVADALISSVERHREDILHQSLLLDVAERIEELRPGSEAVVEADSPGAFYLDLRYDDAHRAHFACDVDWGGSLMRVVGKGETEYADRSFPTTVPRAEKDPAKIARAIVEALEAPPPND